MLEESDHEYTKEKKHCLGGKLAFFLSKWHGIWTSPGFREKSRQEALQSRSLWRRVELFEKQQPSTEHGGPARKHSSAGRDPDLRAHFLNCRPTPIGLNRTNLHTATTHSRGQRDSTNGLIRLDSPSLCLAFGSKTDTVWTGYTPAFVKK